MVAIADPDGENRDEVLDSIEAINAEMTAEAEAPAKMPAVCLEPTTEFFSENSPLKEAAAHGGRPYEPRPQQTEMAVEIARSLEAGENLCIEAPTGIGKSFAYLVPAIHFALSTRKAVLVTTETLNLQEQLVYKDLPLLQELLGLDFKFVLAKGRGNYLCRRRLELALGGHRDEYLSAPGLIPDVERLAIWAEKTADGSKYDIDFHVDPDLWNCVCSEATNCSGASCKFQKLCFYFKARKEWEKADIVVANHALFFIDLKISMLEKLDSSPLPVYGAVIFDEAHTLEDSAADHLGLSLRSAAIKHFLTRLYNPANGRGLLLRKGETFLEIRGQIAKAHAAADQYFLQFQEAVEEKKDSTFRIYKPGRFSDEFSPKLYEIALRLKNAAEDLEDDPDFKQELLSQMEKCQCYADEVSAFTAMKLNDHVYWAEGKPSRLARMPLMELSAEPLNVAEILRQILFVRDFPVILTSATLAVNGSLDYFFRRTGFARGSGFTLDSPFDYSKQVKLFLPHNEMPLPSDENFLPVACDKIMQFLEMTEGHAFVLFTSFGMLKTCAENLAADIRKMGVRLLIHGEALSRTAMLQEFKDVTQSSVIFGATSFWTGVDVPGSALSNVIITKLPFAVPTHPLIAARIERIQEAGGNAFSDYSIPDAVLKFRQGIGRLIRSKTDTGIIVILDRRIVSKTYGQKFLHSFPPCPTEYF